jgi:DNA-binding XRE family transcriptional regulator
MTSDSRALSTVMTATLSADLEGRVPAGLVADVVRAVLDESRQAAPDRGVEPTMLEARRRLECFIRARSSRWTRTTAPTEGVNSDQGRYRFHRHRRKPIVSTIIITVNSKEHDRLVDSTVQAMRRSVGATVAQLAKASGIPRPSIEAIEAGGTTTRAERHDITVALGWLSNNRVAKALTT